MTERHLRDGYRERDLLPGGVETVIGADSTLTETVDRIMRDTGPAEPAAPAGTSAGGAPPPVGAPRLKLFSISLCCPFLDGQGDLHERLREAEC